MKTDTVVRARIDSKTKSRAARALRGMGLSISDYIRMALIRVARDQAIPFPVKVPNASTRKAMNELGRGKGKKFANAEDLFEDLGI